MTGRTARAVLMLGGALCLGGGCGGGGGGGSPDLAAVVEVTYGDTGSKSGLTYLDDGPVRIVLADWLEDFPNPGYLQHVLRHELFHALTGIREHPTDPACVSCDDRSPNSGPLAMPCAWEREEMRASERAPMRVRFGGHLAEIWDAATWWNQGVLAVVFEVVE